MSRHEHDEHELEQLIDRHLQGELDDAEKERLAAWLDSDESAARAFVEHVEWDTRLTELLRHRGQLADEAQEGRVTPSGTRFRERWAENLSLARILAAAVAVLIVVTAVALVIQRSGSRHQIARITGMSGSLQWTGDGGRVSRNLIVGTRLPGGTVEGLAPDSWFELEFNDGSTVMISGHSILTFSDHGQKELHFKEGSISGNVRPQPDGKPMLIHTRSALLEVVGTQFDVETDLVSTTLQVAEGTVRVKRLGDGCTVDVPARHRVVAGADHELAPTPVADVVHHWKSDVPRGPEGIFGTWLPESAGREARVKGIPFIPQENLSITLYLLGFSVDSPEGSPVILQPDSRFIVRGSLETPGGIYFGIQMADSDGEFAGKFRADCPAPEIGENGEFSITYHINEFKLDPCVRFREDELPANPIGLEVTGVWSFTPGQAERSPGFEISEVQLLIPGQPSGE